MKWKRAEGLGVKAGKEPKRAHIKGSDVEVDLGSESSDLVEIDLGSGVTQDLLVMLLGIWQEMSVQSEIMRQMLQVSMVQLEVLWVRGVDLASQAEAVCRVRSGQSVVRTQEARLRLMRLWEMELRGCALEAMEKSQDPSGSGEKPELGPVKGPSEKLEEALR